MKKINCVTILFAMILGTALFYSIQGFDCYGFHNGLPICTFVTYSDTFGGDIADWIWDDEPWRVSPMEIIRGSSLMLLCIILMFIPLQGMNYIKEKRKKRCQKT